MSDDFDFDFESGSPARDGAASHLPVPTAQVGLSDIWRPEGGTALMTVRDLGRVLQSDGVIDAAQLATARASQEKDPTRRLEDIFREMGVSEPPMQKALAGLAHLTFERVEVGSIEGNKYVNRLGLQYCLNNDVLPLRFAGSRVVVGVVYVDDLILLDELRHKLNHSIKPVVVTRGDIQAAIESMQADEDARNDSGDGNELGAAMSMDEVLEGIDEDDVEVVENDEENLDLEKMAGESPVIRYVNYLIFNAVKEGASDIHCLLYTSPSPRDQRGSRMPSSA